MTLIDTKVHKLQKNVGKELGERSQLRSSSLFQNLMLVTFYPHIIHEEKKKNQRKKKRKEKNRLYKDLSRLKNSNSS